MGGVRVNPSWKGTVFLAKTHGNSKMMLVPVITTNNFDNPVNIRNHFLQLELPEIFISHTPKLEVPDSIMKIWSEITLK